MLSRHSTGVKPKYPEEDISGPKIIVLSSRHFDASRAKMFSDSMLSVAKYEL